MTALERIKVEWICLKKAWEFTALWAKWRIEFLKVLSKNLEASKAAIRAKP